MQDIRDFIVSHVGEPRKAVTVALTLGKRPIDWTNATSKYFVYISQRLNRNSQPFILVCIKDRRDPNFKITGTFNIDGSSMHRNGQFCKSTTTVNPIKLKEEQEAQQRLVEQNRESRLQKLKEILSDINCDHSKQPEVSKITSPYWYSKLPIDKVSGVGFDDAMSTLRKGAYPCAIVDRRDWFGDELKTGVLIGTLMPLYHLVDGQFELCGAQIINDHGKFIFSGLTTGYAIFGELSSDRINFVCEGLATGLSAMVAMGALDEATLIVALNTNGLASIRENLPFLMPENTIVLADNDAETAKRNPAVGNPGIKAAIATGFDYAAPVSNYRNLDWCDVVCEHGIDAVRPVLLERCGFIESGREMPMYETQKVVTMDDFEGYDQYPYRGESFDYDLSDDVIAYIHGV